MENSIYRASHYCESFSYFFSKSKGANEMKGKQFIKRNASTILTCIGGVGVIATAVTAVRATPKVVKLLEHCEDEKGSSLTKSEVIQIAGLHYIPSILIGVGTLACIFGANTLNQRQQAALMSAYALVDNSYKEYKKKVNELYGEEAHKEVVTSIAKDKYAEEGIEVGDGKKLFYDDFSGRYFESTSKDVIEAEYNLNRNMAYNSGAYLNEFYEFLGLEPIEAGKELGWSQGILEAMYWAEWVEFDHERVLLEDGLECYIITMRYEPVIDFAYY
jgi:hypothetical protein